MCLLGGGLCFGKRWFIINFWGVVGEMGFIAIGSGVCWKETFLFVFDCVCRVLGS